MTWRLQGLGLGLGLGLLLSQSPGALGAICTLDQLGAGRWEPFALDRKSFQCCGYGLSYGFLGNWSDPIVKGECGRSDIPEKLYAFHGSNVQNMQVPSLQCLADFVTSARTTPSVVEQYKWKPHGCTILPWDARRFCEVLGNRTVVLVGDSLMKQAATSLHNMVIRSVPRGYCAPQLHFYTLSRADSHGRQRIRGVVQRHGAEVVVLGMGAHYMAARDLERYAADVSVLMEEVAWIRSNSALRVRFFWKSLLMPHVDCAAVSQVPSHEPIVPLAPRAPFGWDLLPAMDALARERVAQLGVVWLNMSSLAMRPDAHPGSYSAAVNATVDCQHYVLPGPLNVFSQVMLHALSAE